MRACRQCRLPACPGHLRAGGDDAQRRSRRRRPPQPGCNVWSWCRRGYHPVARRHPLARPGPAARPGCGHAPGVWPAPPARRAGGRRRGLRAARDHRRAVPARLGRAERGPAAGAGALCPGMEHLVSGREALVDCLCRPHAAAAGRPAPPCAAPHHRMGQHVARRTAHRPTQLSEQPPPPHARTGEGVGALPVVHLRRTRTAAPLGRGHRHRGSPACPGARYPAARRARARPAPSTRSAHAHHHPAGLAACSAGSPPAPGRHAVRYRARLSGAAGTAVPRAHRPARYGAPARPCRGTRPRCTPRAGGAGSAGQARAPLARRADAGHTHGGRHAAAAAAPASGDCCP